MTPSSCRAKVFSVLLISLIATVLLFPLPLVFAQTTHEVFVGPGFKFHPEHLSIAPGDTVAWVWVRGFHDIVSGPYGEHDGHFRAPATSVTGTIFRVAFDGKFLKGHPAPSHHYPYFCLVHLSQGMRGSITVTAASPPSPLSPEVTVFLLIIGGGILFLIFRIFRGRS